MLLSTHPFRVGDFVEVGTVSGTVQEIGMTYTTLVTPDQKEIFVPNSEVAAAKIINYTAVTNRRVDLTFTASYDDAAETVKAALLKAADLPQVYKDPAPFAAVNRYGDSAIEYVLRVWTAATDYWDVYFAIVENVRVRFEEAGISMTYPHLKGLRRNRKKAGRPLRNPRRGPPAFSVSRHHCSNTLSSPPSLVTARKA